MKKINSILACLLLTASLSFTQQATAQAPPQKMSYQSVIRNSSNVLLANTAVGIRISVLQGSASGPAVYVETQTANTNGNGLVSIKIGTGTATTGTFAGINWATGTYFIKTETDPAGGTNYSITGTQEILSVPYAMYAGKSGDSTIMGAIGSSSTANGGTITAGVLSLTPADATNGGIVTTGAQTIAGSKTLTGTLGVGTTTLAASAVLEASSTTKGFLPPRMDSTQRNAIVSPAAGLTIYNTTLKSVQVYNGTVWSSTAHYIGESYGGGIVFYVYDNGQHGLIAATADQNGGTGIRWYGGSNTNTMAKADGIGAGKSNTDIIISNQSLGDGSTYAARICHDDNGGNYGDWYLPSKYELNLLYLKKNVVGGFANNFYWSSTEADSPVAWGQSFDLGTPSNAGKGGTYYVRAIRAF